MKKTALSVLTLILLIISCQKNKKITEYEINGVLKNVPDSSVVYISINNKNIDSTIVLQEKFKLSGNIEKPTNVFLVIKNSLDYKSFWLENNKINFTAEKGKFRDAKITGSKTQQENDILIGRLKEIDIKMENIENSFDDSMTEIQKDSLNNQYELLEIKETITYQEFVKDFPNSLVSSHILEVYATTWGKEKTLELFNKFSLENKDSEYGKKITNYINLNKEPKIGEQFADFEMKDQNGKFKRLSEVKGKTVLLEFWASWCGPCRKENPNLVKTYKKFNSKGFEIFAVSLDVNKNNWIKVIEKDSLNWIHVSDLKGDGNKASLIYGINEIPDNFLINQSGKIIGRNLRGEKLNQKLKEILE